MFVYCDGCRRALEPGEQVYQCLDCTDFVFCVACYEVQGEAHGHLMALESHTPSKTYWRQLAWCRSVGNIYYMALHHFAGRPLLGVGCDVPADASHDVPGDALPVRLELRRKPQAEGPVDGFREIGPWGPLEADGRARAGIHWLTFQGTLAVARACGAALRHRLALPPEARIGLCAPNGPQWFCIDVACALYGLVLAPFHQALSDEHAAALIQEAELEALVVDAAAMPRFRKIAARCPDVRHLIAIDDDSDIRRIYDVSEAFGEASRDANGWAVDVPAAQGRWRESSLSGLMAWGVSSPAPLVPAPEEMLFTIACTSGSTGKPKGVVFSGTSWRKRFCRPVPLSPEVVVSFQPLSFASARSNLYISLVNGGRIGFHEGREIDGIFDTFQRFRPSLIISVPRLWNRLYADYQAALALARLQEGVSWADAEAQVMAGFADMLGGRTQFLLSGGAPIAPAVLSFLERCYRCRVGDGYGITECGSITTEERLKDDVVYRIEDLPNLGYTRADQPYPRGELWVKTDAMADGYLHDESDEDGQARFVDGWFRTGDVVEERAPRVLRVIDRCAHVIKLAQGVFVSPEQLEQVYQACPLVSQIYLHCDPLRSGILALVVPNMPALAAAIGAPPEQISAWDEPSYDGRSWLHARSDEAAQRVRQALSVLADEAGLRSFERPQDVGLVWTPFSIANGTLTPTSKLSRRAIASHHKAHLDAMAHAIDSRDQASLKAQLIAIVRDYLKGEGDNVTAGPGDPSDPGRSLGLDSLAAVSIKAEMLARCQIDLPLEQLLAVDGLDELLALVTPDVGGTTTASVSSTSAEPADSSVPADAQASAAAIIPLSPAAVALRETIHSLWEQRETLACAAPGGGSSGASYRKILLTGATGFVGPHLLVALLAEHPEAEIACLVRAADGAIATGEARLRQACLAQQVWADVSRQHSRVSVVVGDLSRPRLGLDEDSHKRLGDGLDLIVHNGAWVNHALPYERLQMSNVGGTVESLRLAADAGARYLFVSSTSAIDGALWRAGGERLRAPSSLVEMAHSASSLEAFAASLGGYGASKAMAEMAVSLALEAGLVCQVVRPGYLGAHSATGACHPGGSIERMLRACWALRAVPQVAPEAGLNALAVDVAAAAIAALSSPQRWPSLPPRQPSDVSGEEESSGSPSSPSPSVQSSPSGAWLSSVVTHVYHPHAAQGLVSWSSLFAAMAALVEKGRHSEVGAQGEGAGVVAWEALPFDVWWQRAHAAQRQAIVAGEDAPLVGLLELWRAGLPDQSQRTWPAPRRLLERLPELAVEGWGESQIETWVKACVGRR